MAELTQRLLVVAEAVGHDGLHDREGDQRASCDRCAVGIHVVVDARDPLFVAVPSDHELAARESVTVADLAGQRHVLYPRERPSFADRIVQTCLDAGFQPTVAHEAGSIVIAVGYVAIDAVVAIVPQPALRLRMDGVTFVPLDSDRSEDFSCITLAGRRGPTLDRFIRFLDAWSPGAR